MAENKENLDRSWRAQVALAKLLLTKYGFMHSFHEEQMGFYATACCMISLGGQYKVMPETKTIEYEIVTEKYFQKIRKENVKRSPVASVIAVPPWKYKKECSIAKHNLNKWTRELMWGDETKVVVKIDGVVI
jgi:hypothetical protein